MGSSNGAAKPGDEAAGDGFAGMLAGTGTATGAAKADPGAKTADTAATGDAARAPANEDAALATTDNPPREEGGPEQLLALLGGPFPPPPAATAPVAVFAPLAGAAGSGLPSLAKGSGGAEATAAVLAGLSSLVQAPPAAEGATTPAPFAPTGTAAMATPPLAPAAVATEMAALPQEFAKALEMLQGRDAGADTLADTAGGPESAERPQATVSTAPAALTRASPAALASGPVALPADPDAGFDEGFGARIGWLAEQRIGRAEIRVSPDHAGPIDVRLQMDGSRVSAEFSSANADVRQALEASMGRLRDQLAQHGLELAQADVGSGGRQPGQAQAAEGLVLEDGAAETAISVAPLVRRGLLDEYA
ncbi:flagellar hook-length control protein FliK [Novilysobacter spongiicola]|uniref:Flagellar hook-length control protein FliK n=1 Tax=Lysobacter spongiicola DSM 21749 TaxID=1122188 RepID=A0A1T4S0U1_9GAMM|nr:flagellar hook-length control protein FliK [Lysobacter spongiicola]SKA21726.1 flagellar hook-length control protein FliK [Lysobacter spongiicola DSM 21749]